MWMRLRMAAVVVLGLLNALRHADLVDEVPS
jgi:hypothetical protein